MFSVSDTPRPIAQGEQQLVELDAS